MVSRSTTARRAPGVSVHDPRLPPPFQRGRQRGGLPSLLTRILTVAAGALVLIGAVAISFVVFVIVLAALLVIGLYVWWKTRHIRRRLEEQLNAQRSDAQRSDEQRAGAPRGETIEGEVLHKRESDPRQR